MQDEQENSGAGFTTPADRKRIALLVGATGQSERLRIRGQVADIPISEEQRQEEWTPFHNLPRSHVASIRPMQDFTMLPVRRPRLQIEILAVDPRKFDPAKLSEYQVVHETPQFTGADDSFFECPLNATLPPGRYTVRVILRRIDSMRQSIADLAFIGQGDSEIIKKDLPIGYGKLRVLPPDSRGDIVTSDIDQTFLDTPLHSSQGLMETLFQSPEAKAHIAGLPEFYKELRREQDLDRPLLFISASPHFFRRTLSAVFDHHGIEYSALHLKHLQGTLDAALKKALDAVFNMGDYLGQGLQHSLERTAKFFGSSLASIFDQISYKLLTLLENRLMQPPRVREILMGDNTEGDFFIFSLYQFLLRGDLTGQELEDYLYHLHFQNREALTRDAARRIRQLTERIHAELGTDNTVRAVWINRSREEPDEAAMLAEIRKALPVELRPAFDDGTGLALPRACAGGAGFALAALDEGSIDLEAALRVLRVLPGDTFGEEPIDQARVEAWVREFPFRNPELSADAILEALRNPATGPAT